MNLFGGAKSPDFLFKAYKNLKRPEILFLSCWFDCPDKLQTKNLPTYDSFNGKLYSSNPIRAHKTDYWKVEWLENKPSSKWNCQNYHPQ